MPRTEPTRWEFLWLGYAEKKDLARVWPDRLRRKGRGLRVLGYCLIAALLIAGIVWVIVNHQRSLMAPLTGVICLSVVAITTQSHRRLFRLPTRRLARLRLRVRRLPEAELASELRRRRAWWRQVLLSSRPNHTQTPELWWVFGGVLVGMAVVDQIMQAFLFTGLHAVFYSVVALGVTAVYARCLTKRDHRRLVENACMNCGYPLAEVPGEWAEPQAAGAAATDNPAEDPIREWVGPPRCPECGCDWPLIPPGTTSRNVISTSKGGTAKPTGTSPR